MQKLTGRDIHKLQRALETLECYDPELGRLVQRTTLRTVRDAIQAVITKAQKARQLA